MKLAAKWGLNLFTYGVAMLFFFPVFWIILNAFKTESQAYNYPPVFIFQPIMDNIINAFGSGQYLLYLNNSLVVSVLSVIVVNILALPLAFYLAELKWYKRKDRLFGWILSTKFMPAVGIVIPLYIILIQTQMLNSLWGLFIMYMAMSMPIIVLVMRSFFLDIPVAIIEAAAIDGASYFTTFTRIILPMSIPGIATASILAIILNYNEFFFATVLSGPQSQTLPVYLSSFMTSEGLFWAQVSGISLLAIFPILVLGWLAQKRIVRGLTLGAVK
ncbi:carbohydrate ABC transporter permease [Domibacillus robiginosus]|uniref:carbohydrate ABC transporter permease n=1 Tax=Domibacillus robiginosus TaxID=1071054 RepID=UPI00067D378F|nr:carbohydrate ABC transporter permease [Domibacillus robiginosus]